jgi:hypothetical protein
MRFARLLLSFVLAGSLLIPTAVPQTTTNPQAVQYLQRALAAISANTPLSDVTLSGSAHRIAGSDDETGTATLKAIAGASRIDLNLSSGPRSEIYNSSGGYPAGTWSGPDGVSHAISLHNLLTDPAWFFPAFPITHGLSSGYGATYVGHETREGQAVEHLTIFQASGVQSPAGVPAMAHLSQMDFFIDSTTFLPASVTFNVHPDNNELLDIPIEVRFSDYRSVTGVQVPFHVEKYLNNSLILDLQFQNVTLNTGLTASSFSL